MDSCFVLFGTLQQCAPMEPGRNRTRHLTVGNQICNHCTTSTRARLESSTSPTNYPSYSLLSPWDGKSISKGNNEEDWYPQYFSCQLFSSIVNDIWDNWNYNQVFLIDNKFLFEWFFFISNEWIPLGGFFFSPINLSIQLSHGVMFSQIRPLFSSFVLYPCFWSTRLLNPNYTLS